MQQAEIKRYGRQKHSSTGGTSLYYRTSQSKKICISYRALNRITRSSKFSFRWCKDEILYIGKAKHHISIDMALRYWQVISNKASHAKLAFFGINAKLTWTRISMGDHNAEPFFGAMTEVPQDFQEDSDKRHILDCILEVIMDDKMLFAVSL